MMALDRWENFYVIVGSSAGALIGLQFVVMTLIADAPYLRSGSAQAGDAFGTPSVVHFGAVLLLSALVSIPWNGMTHISLLWGLVGLCGFIYSLIIIRRVRTQTVYQLVGEDWLFHVLLPLAAYTVLAASSVVSRSHERPALFLVAAAVLLLLFVGIHNAWDTVVYHVFIQRQEYKESEKSVEPKEDGVKEQSQQQEEQI